MGKKAEAFATDLRISRSKRISHGLTRKEDISFRAGSVSDGINILFGKGPFDRLRDRGSFGTVSELAELLAVKFRDREILAVCICPEGAK